MCDGSRRRTGDAGRPGWLAAIAPDVGDPMRDRSRDTQSPGAGGALRFACGIPASSRTKRETARTGSFEREPSWVHLADRHCRQRFCISKCWRAAISRTQGSQPAPDYAFVWISKLYADVDHGLTDSRTCSWRGIKGSRATPGALYAALAPPSCRSSSGDPVSSRRREECGSALDRARRGRSLHRSLQSDEPADGWVAETWLRRPDRGHQIIAEGDPNGYFRKLRLRRQGLCRASRR